MVIPNLPQMCQQPHDSLCISLGLRAAENSNFIMENNHPQHLNLVREVAVVIGVYECSCGHWCTWLYRTAIHPRILMAQAKVLCKSSISALSVALSEIADSYFFIDK